MVIGAVGAALRGRNTTVENWFEVPTFGTGRVGAPVFCFGVRASTEGTYYRVLASGFNMAKPPTIVALLGGRGGVGSFDDIAAAEDRNFGDIGEELPFLGRHLHHDEEDLRAVEERVPVGVKEAGLGNQDGL